MDHGQGTSHSPAWKSSFCRRVAHVPFSNDMASKPVCVHLVYGKSTSRLQLLPDTSADVIVIGQQYFGMLHILYLSSTR